MKLSKKQRKQLRDFRRKRQNKRSVNAGEYGFGKTEDRRKTNYEELEYYPKGKR